MLLDTINGLFETLAGAVLATSCWRLYRDKQVKGVSALHALFFAAWGYWNLFYYPKLGQWRSFAGGVGVVFFNTTWFILFVVYQWSEIRETATLALWRLSIARRGPRWVMQAAKRCLASVPLCRSFR